MLTRGKAWMCEQLQLRRLPCANPLPAELAARQFMSIEGVGESTATALALTHTLGGSQHSDLASLRAWAKQDRGIQLAIFLLSRSGPSMCSCIVDLPAAMLPV